MEPAFVGMPPTDRQFVIGKLGTIRCGGECRDDYKRIHVFHDHNGRVVTLQEAALQAFKNAEAELGFAIVITGSHRSCDLQRRLFMTDRNRFAPPDKTAHCRGLAIDVSMDQSKTRLTKIHDALSKRHWFQSRPTDEPWHYSFGIQV